MEGTEASSAGCRFALLPNLGALGSRVFHLARVREAGGPGRVCQHDRGDVPDRAVRSLFVVMSTPAVQLFASIFQRQEPVGVHAFAAQLAVERLDERVVGGLSWAREIERHAPLVSP